MASPNSSPLIVNPSPAAASSSNRAPGAAVSSSSTAPIAALAARLGAEAGDAGGAPHLQTARGQATNMPERSGDWLEIVNKCVAEATDRGDAVTAYWDQLVQDFWVKAKAQHAAGSHETRNRDCRDFAAVVERVIPAVKLDLILSMVYHDMPEQMKKKKLLPEVFSRAMQAATTSLRSVPGASIDAEVTKWRMFLWFGREITTTVRQLKAISEVMQATKKTAKVTFAELTNRLWRKVLADRAQWEHYPEPSNAHMTELVRELQAEKATADEAIAMQRQERELRLQALEKKKEDSRKRGKRPRVADEDEDDEDDEESVGGGAPGPSARKRRRVDEADDGVFLPGLDDETLPSEEVGRRGSIRNLEDLPENHWRDSAYEIGEWLSGNAWRMQDLEGPKDPDNIIPEDVKQHLAAIRMSLAAVNMRLADVKNNFS